MTEGVTAERAAKGNVVLRAREVSKGGNVLTVGQVDEWHCYLDFLKDVGLLGEEPFASRRYDDGMAFRELYYDTHYSGALSFANKLGAGRDAEGERIADINQTKWLLATRYLGQKRYRLLMTCCVETDAPAKPVAETPMPPMPDLKKTAEAFEKDRCAFEEWTKAMNRRLLQISLLTCHMRTFRAMEKAVFDALDAIAPAMERAEREVQRVQK